MKIINKSIKFYLLIDIRYYLSIIKEKIIQKGCDYLFANPIDLPGQGFGFLSHNEGWLFDKQNMEHYIKKTSKIDLANKLITQIITFNK